MKIFSWLVILIFLSGCSTVVKDFTKGESVKSEGNSFFNRSYSQGGDKVNVIDMVSKLKDYRLTQSQSTAGQKWLYAGMGLAALGSGLFTYNLIRSSGEGTEDGMLMGLGILGLGLGAGYFADQNIEESVSIYNKNYGKGSSKAPQKTSQLKIFINGIAYKF